MGFKDKIFGKQREPQAVELPALLKPENPVNYDSVLDYLVGLSKEDYDKITKVTGIYREANRKAATVLNVEDQPTSTLVEEKLSEDELEAGLDSLLIADQDDLKDALLNNPDEPENKKQQAPSKSKKITVNE